MDEAKGPNPSTGALLYIALACCIVSVLASVAHIYGHLANFTERAQQLNIVRILLVVPIYAIGSWLSLRFPNEELYFATVRDCYEAYVVYCFLALVLVYCGGDSVCVARMQEKGTIRHPFPLCRLKPATPDGRFLRSCKQAVLQFVFVKPVFAVVSLIFLAIDVYDSVWYQAILLLVYNVSYSVALYALLLFYIATSEQLSAFHPVWKFFAVKSIVFMTYWQGLAVTIIPGVPSDERNKWENFVLCIEMVLFAILHICAFNYREFSLREGVVHTTVMQNVKQVISQKDVVQDAYHNFMPSYQDYVLHRPYENAPPKKYRAKTFLFGNLGKPTAKASPLSGHDGLQMADRSTAINLASDGDDDDDFGHDSDHNDGGMGRGTQLDVSYATNTSNVASPYTGSDERKQGATRGVGSDDAGDGDGNTPIPYRGRVGSADSGGNADGDTGRSNDGSGSVAPRTGSDSAGNVSSGEESSLVPARSPSSDADAA